MEDSLEPDSMCRADSYTESIFSMRKLADVAPADRPLRPIRL